MKPNFSCVIVDDEPKAVEYLSNSLKELFPNIKVLNVFSTWHTALNGLQSTTCDIVFMDISMHSKNTLSLLRLIPELKSEIIFVTAYDQYAIEVFDFPTSGYLLKPYDDTELFKAVNRALKRLEVSPKSIENNIDKIGIPNNNGIDYISVHDILYIETVNRCSKIMTRSGEFLSSFNIGKFKEILDPAIFFETHRSFVVNINHVIRYLSIGAVIMSNAKEIPVSKAVKDEFLHLFNIVSKGNKAG